ncbi:MAG: hypothetical protein GKR88_13810 [Flavobacteriaceae bacterium]|nr:MAG: hypothetical protein GKR88_13810 [Flavobacteriaceae bacterium]
MQRITQIGGIIINSTSVEILKEKIPVAEIISEPVYNIIEGGTYNQYWVNIFTNIPNHELLIETSNLDSSVLLNYGNFESEYNTDNKESKTKKRSEMAILYLKYNGLVAISTWINSDRDNKRVHCRSFEVLFNAKRNIQDFNLVRTSFNYSVKNPNNSVNAEAILVRNENIDPRTSRGTVTTVRREKR